MARDYAEVVGRIRAVCAGEDDAVALMATVACELYHAFDDFDWVGFYRVTAPELLKIGPYQGGHGCLVIPFDARGLRRGGARAADAGGGGRRRLSRAHRLRREHPLGDRGAGLRRRTGALIAVLDVDSDTPAAFDAGGRGGARGADGRGLRRSDGRRGEPPVLSGVVPAGRASASPAGNRHRSACGRRPGHAHARCIDSAAPGDFARLGPCRRRWPAERGRASGGSSPRTSPATRGAGAADRTHRADLLGVADEVFDSLLARLGRRRPSRTRPSCSRS